MLCLAQEPLHRLEGLQELTVLGLRQVSNTFPLCHVHFAAGQHRREDVLQGPMQVLRAERGQRCARPHRTKGRSLHLGMKAPCAKSLSTTVVMDG